MTRAAGAAMVLGVGNVLLRDDGVGVRVIEELRAASLHDPLTVPDGTRLVDGGTLGMDLLATVREAEALVLVDAVNLGRQPGTVTVLHGDAIVAAGGRDAGAVPGGVGELLAVARLMGWLPDPVVMIGVQVGDTTFGVGLSASVEAAVPEAADAVRRELRSLHEHAATGRSGWPAIWLEREATA
jgi:hydrogenase maturation protease